ncbi:MAG TPA: GAP family protein [bacterium]|nr:GAP family protein [bacterium]
MIAALRRWRKAALLAVGTLALMGAAWGLQYSPHSAGWLWQISDRGTWLLPLISVAALIDSVNPCAFSILLVTIAFLFALGRLRSSVLAIGGLYVAGVFAVYLGIGLGLLQVLHLFDTPHFMARLGAALLVGGGALSIAGELVPGMPRLAVPHAAHQRIATLIDRASLTVAFPLGALVGLCEFPCTGGPYLMAVGLLHDQATAWEGLGYLMLYNVIFVLPLVLILLVASDKRLVEKTQAWHRDNKSAMRLWGGAAMVALGLLIYAL